MKGLSIWIIYVYNSKRANTTASHYCLSRVWTLPNHIFEQLVVWSLKEGKGYELSIRSGETTVHQEQNLPKHNFLVVEWSLQKEKGCQPFRQ